MCAILYLFFLFYFFFFFFKQKTAYEMRISDWSSDVCSSDLADVHRYFRELEKASPRVRVIHIGDSEEGREMIAVAIADEALIAGLDANAARLRQLADPRRIDMDDARADALIAQSTPVYYITGALRSEEHQSELQSLMRISYAVFLLK